MKNELSFTQRTGLEAVPPQLTLGEISDKHRRLLEYRYIQAIDSELDLYGKYMNEWLETFTKDIWVMFLDGSIGIYDADLGMWRKILTSVITEEDYGTVFNFVEFTLPYLNPQVKKEVSDTFILARSAYRIVDDKVVAIGNQEQAETYLDALDATEESELNSVRAHLVASGLAIRNADWSGSIRESIHAVESISLLIEPKAKTLGDALKKIENRGPLHAGLKNAFSILYGYASDEEGVRHAMVYKDKPNVDETDALFMLGACSAFVSYLIARSHELQGN